MFNDITQGRIIIPAADNDGNKLDIATKNVWLVAIAQTFGGYTETAGHGGWIDSDGTLFEDEIFIIDITTEWIRRDILKTFLLALGEDVKAALHQQSVYVKVDDSVAFI